MYSLLFPDQSVSSCATFPDFYHRLPVPSRDRECFRRCCVRVNFPKIFPCLQQLVMDPSEHVRQTLASVLNDMPPMLGRDHTINHLSPMLLSLLRDTNPDVRVGARACVCIYCGACI